jgi:hypothetical protein
MMNKWIAIATLVAAVWAMLAGNSLASPSGDGPSQTQLQDRTCTQTCDPAQDCDGHQIQNRPRTRQDWPDEAWLPADDAEFEFLLWLLGLD